MSRSKLRLDLVDESSGTVSSLCDCLQKHAGSSCTYCSAFETSMGADMCPFGNLLTEDFMCEVDHVASSSTPRR
jgi:hypothetical protein